MDEKLNRIEQALNGEHGEDQQRIAEAVVEFGEKLLKKNSDYGSSVWKVPTLAPNCSVSEAIFVRMSDKIERINSLRKNGTAEIDESLEDTIGDLGAYCVLWLARPTEPNKEEDNSITYRTPDGQLVTVTPHENLSISEDWKLIFC